MALVATAGTALAWDPGTFSSADEQLLFSLTNQDRASAGLNALVNDSYLHKEAEWRAQDMGDRDYFSHQIPPDGNMVFDYMQSDGYCFKVAGENIGLSTYGDDGATTSIETAFMGSPPHRANILGTWAHLGVGAYKAADGRKLYDVLFSIPCGVSVPTPTPVTDPTPAPRPRPPAPRADAGADRSTHRQRPGNADPSSDARRLADTDCRPSTDPEHSLRRPAPPSLVPRRAGPSSRRAARRYDGADPAPRPACGSTRSRFRRARSTRSSTRSSAACSAGSGVRARGRCRVAGADLPRARDPGSAIGRAD